MKSKKIGLIIAYLISVMPTNKLRIFLYRTIFNYSFYKSYIGWNTIIFVEHAELTECSIGRNNKFIGPIHINIDKGASIGKNNRFNCGWWIKEEKFKTNNYEASLNIGSNTMITSGHYFDIVGSFVLGNNSWIAGYGSQFWTHGAGVIDRNINIGERCYLGSAVRFTPNSSIGDNCIIGLGSVVTKNFNIKNAVIAGHPAKVLRENYDWKTQKSIL